MMFIKLHLLLLVFIIFIILIASGNAFTTTYWKTVITCSQVASPSKPDEIFLCIEKSYFKNNKDDEWYLISTDQYYSSTDKTDTLYGISM